MAEITWWGHATVTIADSGVRVLTDPVLVRHVVHLRRRHPVDLGPARDADVVLISHLHMDHLHLPSLAILPARTTIVVPRGALQLVDRLGRRRIREVDVGDEIVVGGLRIHVVRAEHDGHRGPWTKLQAPTLGYVVEGRSTTYFAGDTDIFDDMARLPRLDTALLPTGGWGPNLGPGHLDPERAAHALNVLRAATAIPIHYGTFWPLGMRRVRSHLFHGPGLEFAEQAAQIAPKVTVHVLAPGAAHQTDAASPTPETGSGFPPR